MSLIEVILAALVLSFMVAATAAVYQGGVKQQRTARAYSNAQADIRQGLQRVTRALRHGYRVVATSTTGTLNAQSSGLNQVIVEVPDPGATTKSEIRFHVANNTLYAQRDDEAAPGTALMTGVQTLEFRYYETDPGTGAVPEVLPDSATEVAITVTAERAPAVTTVKTYVMLRNAIGESI